MPEVLGHHADVERVLKETQGEYPRMRELLFYAHAVSDTIRQLIVTFEDGSQHSMTEWEYKKSPPMKEHSVEARSGRRSVEWEAYPISAQWMHIGYGYTHGQFLELCYKTWRTSELSRVLMLWDMAAEFVADGRKAPWAIERAKERAITEQIKELKNA